MFNPQLNSKGNLNHLLSIEGLSKEKIIQILAFWVLTLASVKNLEMRLFLNYSKIVRTMRFLSRSFTLNKEPTGIVWIARRVFYVNSYFLQGAAMTFPIYSSAYLHYNLQKNTGSIRLKILKLFQQKLLTRAMEYICLCHFFES